jgi:membrane protease YdiL (CAAX protease family)
MILALAASLAVLALGLLIDRTSFNWPARSLLGRHYLHAVIVCASFAAFGVLAAGSLTARATLSLLGLLAWPNLNGFWACLYLPIITIVAVDYVSRRFGGGGVTGNPNKSEPTIRSKASGVLAGPVEEIWCRGILLTVGYLIAAPVTGTTGAWVVSVVATSTLFAVLHRQYDRASQLVTGIMGAGFAIIFILTGSLWTVILGHSAWNFLMNVKTPVKLPRLRRVMSGAATYAGAVRVRTVRAQVDKEER